MVSPAIGGSKFVEINLRRIELMKRVASLIVILFAMAALATATSLVFADVTGTWKLSVETPNGTGTPTVILKQDGEKLTGTY